jgi:hypothetical protein
MLPSDAAKPSTTSHDKINGTQSLQLMFSACKLSVYALQWLLPDTAQDSIIDVLGPHFRCNHFQMPAILHFVAHRGFWQSELICLVRLLVFQQSSIFHFLKLALIRHHYLIHKSFGTLMNCYLFSHIFQ